MIASECEQYRLNQEHVSKIVTPIFEKVLIERAQKHNKLLTEFI